MNLVLILIIAVDPFDPKSQVLNDVLSKTFLIVAISKFAGFFQQSAFTVLLGAHARLIVIPTNRFSFYAVSCRACVFKFCCLNVCIVRLFRVI